MKFLAPLIFLFTLAAEANNLDKLKERLKGHIAGAHQGGIFQGLGNTLKQFQLAKTDGVDVIEMDLRITKDGVPIVFHDEKLNTWSRCNGLVRDKTWAEIQGCPLKIREPIPSFEQVLQWSKGEIIVNAEFKDMDVIEPALELALKYDALSWSYYQVQNNPEKYNRARDFNSEVALLFRIESAEQLEDVIASNDPALLIIEVDKSTREKQIIDRIHESGKLVTEDVWHFSWHKEVFGASCREGFRAGIDIAISNRTKSCVKQK